MVFVELGGEGDGGWVESAEPGELGRRCRLRGLQTVGRLEDRLIALAVPFAFLTISTCGVLLITLNHGQQIW